MKTSIMVSVSGRNIYICITIFNKHKTAQNS